MARSTDALRRDTIAQQAQGVGARVTASATNPALQLAASLSEIQPAANQALQNYAGREREKAAVRAKRDSLEASGAKLADAVREGVIEPTSNPWYVQAYSRESAAVRGQSQLSALQVDSASWAEKNDPAAFAERWRKEVGAISEGYASTDEAAGFLPVEGQFTQQALQSNVSQNVTRIATERKQNLSALAASSLSQALVQNGGTLSPNQAAAALEPARLNWLATGGSQADWNMIAVRAVTSASYSTGNAGALDLLKAPELVHGESDGGNAPLGDGVEDSSEPMPIAAIAPVKAEAVVPGKRWSSGELKAVVPFNGVVTSGVRSAEKNKSVGGKANSQHLRGTAIDVVFPKGTSAAAVRAHYAAQGAQVDVIDEGDHFHIQGARNPVGGAKPPAAQAPAVIQAQDTPELAAPPVDAGPQAQFRGPSLYDIEGVADQVESDRYRIQSAREAKQTQRLREQENAVKQSGLDGYNALYETHGLALLTGEVTSTQLIQEMQGAGYKPQAIAETLRRVRGDLQDNAGMANARVAVNGSDPGAQRQLMDIQVEATRSGVTPGLEDRVGALVMQGVITGEDGAGIIAKAVSRSRTLVEQNRSDTNYAQSQSERSEKAVSKSKSYTALKRSSTNIASLLATKLQGAGKTLDPKTRRGLNQAVADAAQAHLALNPDDFAGAEQAARNKAAELGRRAMGAQARPSTPARPSTQNNRR